MREQGTKRKAKETFLNYGLGMILLSRSSPIFPEVCACMAGMTKTRFSKFALAWIVNSVPYAVDLDIVAQWLVCERGHSYQNRRSLWYSESASPPVFDA